jgi:hypothetical protein
MLGPITMKNMRSQAIHDLDADPQTSVLHRLILGTVGRPLWEYTSDSDLLIGFRDAIRRKLFLKLSLIIFSLSYSTKVAMSLRYPPSRHQC